MKKIFYFVIVFVISFLARSYSAEISSPVYFIQQDFDVLHYDIKMDLTQAPEKYTNAKCEIMVKWLQSPVGNKFYFHLRDLTVDSVFYDSEKVQAIAVGEPNDSTYHYEVSTPVGNTKEVVNVKVYYHGTMTAETGTSTWGGVSSIKGNLFAMGVGFGCNYVSCGQHWFPCYDHPSDKATFNVEFIVKPGTVAVSNGILSGITTYGENKLYSYSEELPCATYLMTFAVNNYVSTRFNEGANLPITVYSLAKDTTMVNYSFKLVPKMVEAYEYYFGEYPFEALGYVLTPIGSMEHQTMISFDSATAASCYRKKDSMNLVAAHELSHQWFGDAVTCRDFRDTWLNEGFATYCEALWREYMFGFQANLSELTTKMESYLNYYMPHDGVMPLYDYNRKSPSSNYPGTIYYKGAMVLAMLRYELGDSVFFATLRSYFYSNRYSTVTTEIFQNTCETVSGKDLDWFFNQWVYGKGVPKLNLEITKLNAPYSYAVKVTQVQPSEYGTYKDIPFEINYNSPSGRLISRVDKIGPDEKYLVLDSVGDLSTLTFNKGSQVRSLFSIANITNVEEATIDKVNDITIMPNPACTIITADFHRQVKNGSIAVYDSLGRPVLSETQVFGEQSCIINISGLSNGSYYIVLKNGNYVQYKHFVVLK